MKFIAGVILGTIVQIGYTHLMSTHLNTPKYVAGTCLSNGLYFEQITGIRHGDFTHQVKYETISYIQGHLDSRPSTTETWIVDESYVKVNESNRKVKK